MSRRAAAAWSSFDDVRQKLRRRWTAGEFLRALARGEPWQPVALPLRAPTSAELAADFGAAQDWLSRWRQIDNTLVRLEWKTIGGRVIGTNTVPAKVVIERAEQLWRLLRVAGEVERFTALLDRTHRAAPALAGWVADHPMKALAQADRWDRLVDTVRWIERYGGPDRYLRQVDVPGVDTKFIEQHRGVLAELLDRQLPPERVAAEHPPSRFVQRYRLRGKPAYVRLRSLDATPPAGLAPYRELTVRAEELAAVPIAATRVFVVENEITYLALPPVDGALAILGGGYAASALGAVPWLADRELVYWGDIDTHGFAILDRLRAVFPQVRSMLMDRSTLLANRPHWGREASPVNAVLPALTPAESALYADLVADAFGPAVRLEQERIRFSRVEQALLSEAD